MVWLIMIPIKTLDSEQLLHADDKEIFVAIKIGKLKELITENILCIADLRSLDQMSKKQLWSLCLYSCKHSLKCDVCKNRFKLKS